MKIAKWILIVLNLSALLAFVNYSAIQNEKIFKDGKLIYLELIESTPKSPLIQGDVMNLKYTVAKGLLFDTVYKQGYIVVKLDSNSVAERIRFQHTILPKLENEYLIECKKGYYAVSIGAEQYFLQQGDAKKYTLAKYGALRVDASGKTLLMGLYDEHLKKIE
jgi:uncharacterized membrane-anchored protein